MNVKSDKAMQMLTAASEGDWVAIERLLSEPGAPSVDCVLEDAIDEKDAQDPAFSGSLGRTPLMVAIGERMTQCAENLARLSDPAKTNPLGQTALTIAVIHGMVAVVRILAERGSPLASRDFMGRTPLMHAAAANCPEAIEALLERGPGKVEPNAVCLDGGEETSAMGLAARSGGMRAARALRPWTSQKEIEAAFRQAVKTGGPWMAGPRDAMLDEMAFWVPEAMANEALSTRSAERMPRWGARCAAKEEAGRLRREVESAQSAAERDGAKKAEGEDPAAAKSEARLRL
jgi:ankyrin repeat protein